MKTTFRIIVIVLFAVFYGCQKNEVSIGVNSSITIDGLFSGTIGNDSNRIDSIKAYDNNSLIGKSAVSSAGKFSVTLTTSFLHKIGNNYDGLIISDTTAIVADVFDFKPYKGGVYAGYVSKDNSSINGSAKVDQSTSLFMYSDRTFTIKGTEIHVNTNNGFTYKININYSVTFKKGWNEFVCKTSYSTTSTTTTVVETYSNTITSDLQWRYVPSPAFSVPAKTRGVQDVVRQGFLFR